jgi:hypothetical protein
MYIIGTIIFNKIFINVNTRIQNMPNPLLHIPNLKNISCKKSYGIFCIRVFTFNTVYIERRCFIMSLEFSK